MVTNAMLRQFVVIYDSLEVWCSQTVIQFQLKRTRAVVIIKAFVNGALSMIKFD